MTSVEKYAFWFSPLARIESLSEANLTPSELVAALVLHGSDASLPAACALARTLISDLPLNLPALSTNDLSLAATHRRFGQQMDKNMWQVAVNMVLEGQMAHLEDAMEKLNMERHRANFVYPAPFLH